MRRRNRVLLGAAWCVAALGLGCTTPTAPRAPQQAAATLQLVLVSDLGGVLEPCGCGGHDAGGVDRVTAAVDALRAQQRDTLVLALGEQFAAHDAREPPSLRDAARWKGDAMREVLQRLRADALVTAGASPTSTLLPGPHPIGLASASFGSWSREDDRAATELATAIAELRRRGAIAVVAAVDGGVGAEDGVWQALGADLVVQTGTGSEQPGARLLGERAVLLRPSHHGEAVTSVALLLPAARSYRVALLPDDDRALPSGAIGVRLRHRVLDETVPRDPEVRALLTGLFARIDQHHAREATLDAEPAALGDALRYVGSETCAACHTQAYYWWRATAHGRALATLTARGRQRDFECVGCHVTGYDAGAPSLRGLEQRAGVGCESCHGPGSAHADNPRPPHRGLSRAVPEARCKGCHDHEHSGPFDYAERRQTLLVPAHGGG